MSNGGNISDTDGVGLAAKSEFLTQIHHLIKVDQDLGDNYLKFGKLCVMKGFLAANKQFMASLCSAGSQIGGGVAGLHAANGMSKELAGMTKKNTEITSTSTELASIKNKGAQGALVTSSGKPINTQAELDAHVSNLETKKETLSNQVVEHKQKMKVLSNNSTAYSTLAQGGGALGKAFNEKNQVEAQTANTMADRADKSEKTTSNAVESTEQNICQSAGRMYVYVGRA